MYDGPASPSRWSGTPGVNARRGELCLPCRVTTCRTLSAFVSSRATALLDDSPSRYSTDHDSESRATVVGQSHPRVRCATPGSVVLCLRHILTPLTRNCHAAHANESPTQILRVFASSLLRVRPVSVSPRRARLCLRPTRRTSETIAPYSAPTGRSRHNFVRFLWDRPHSSRIIERQIPAGSASVEIRRVPQGERQQFGKR